jgi:futalosine hydrolase
MNILIVFPSRIEASGFSIPNTKHTVSVLISGIAVYNTMYSLQKYLSKHAVDLVIHAGIAGSFHETFSYNQIVSVTEDCFADVGLYSETGFTSLFDMNLADANAFPFSKAFLQLPKLPYITDLPTVRGVTVNQVTSNEQRKQHLIRAFNPVVETMEGAGVHFVCLQESIPCIHLRAISNMVGNRDVQMWTITPACKALHAYISEALKRV